MNTTGVLLMAYGGPDSLADIPAFLLDVREGRPTPQALIDEITENYRQIGGKSPLLEITCRQAAALEDLLNRQATAGRRYKTYVGMRHWTPRIAEAVAQMVADGVRQAVALVLAPHYSGMSIARYFARLDEALAAQAQPFTYQAVQSYHDHPLLIAALADGLRHKLADLPPDTAVIFSAHSLPVRVLESGDPYDAQVKHTARLVAGQVGLPADRWTFAYQSAGRSQEPWLGPPLEEVVLNLVEAGYRQLLSCPVGFVADHVEVLFDIDIKARGVAEAAGARLERVPSLNDHPLFVAALADLVQQYERQEQ